MKPARGKGEITSNVSHATGSVAAVYRWHRQETTLGKLQKKYKKIKKIKKINYFTCKSTVPRCYALLSSQAFAAIAIRITTLLCEVGDIPG